MEKYNKYWKGKMPEVLDKLKATSNIEIDITDIVKVSNRIYGAKFKIANQRTYTARTFVPSIKAPKTYGMDFFEELIETTAFKKQLTGKTLHVEISKRNKGKVIPIKLKMEVVPSI